MEEMVCTASSIFYIDSALEISVNQTNIASSRDCGCGYYPY